MSAKIHVATRKGLLTVSRGARGWQIERADLLAEPVTASLYDARDGSLYAALRLGHFGPKLRRSRDGGQTWQEISAPAFPAIAAADDGSEPDANAKAASVDMIWSLECGGADEPGVLWAGTIPGALFRSTDAGESWQLNQPLWQLPARKEWLGGGYDQPGIHSICVDPRDSRRILIGISCGGVWYSDDGGNSWSVRAQGMRAAYMPPERAFEPNIQDPHRLVACKAQPDHLWVQHHNGIFRSVDAGLHWQEIETAKPSAFGFAVAVHPQQPDTAWFVPAVKDECRVPVEQKLVVTRTRDGGRSFEQLRTGLPQQHCFDLIYRHGLDVDASGNVLAMGSTTGNLWLSEDQGDSWQLLSSHLPPIYSVRFG
ncbi:exo-alpha-sialidase [Permianibacter sp. IMCC34836]|uniref:WD40/YVTN/BNR-like repeat-containing protein n=1 Tax=Permianibacter fluminis TaxID=2738515 RepID=UPI00155447EA|nr:sialidase family protein [Permianibacter fluminis]NQD38088.1 exo-alpha-sialidase [Permianibacter fluminis]